MKRRWRYNDDSARTRNLKSRKLYLIESYLKDKIEYLNEELEDFEQIHFVRRNSSVVEAMQNRTIGRGDIQIRYFSGSGLVQKIQVFLGGDQIVEEVFQDGVRMEGIVDASLNEFLGKGIEYCPYAIVKDFPQLFDIVKKILEIKKESGEDYDRIIEDGTTVTCGTRKKKVVGFLLNSFAENDDIPPEDLLLIKSPTCWGHIRGKERWCSGCRDMRKNIDRKHVSESMHIEVPELEDETKEELELVRLVGEAFENKKLNEEMKIYKTICDMIGMCMRNRYSVRGMDFPHLFQVAISTKIDGNEGLFGGKWVDGKSGVSTFDGNFIMPSEKSVDRVLEYFRYGPGVQRIPMEVILCVFKAVKLISAFGKVCVDWMYPRRGGTPTSFRKIKFIIGPADYGVKSREHIHIKKIVIDLIQNCSDTEHKKLLERSLEAINYIENLQNSELQEAAKLMAVCLCFQATIGNQENVLIYFPTFLFFENSVSQKECRYTINMSLMALDAFFQSKKAEEECCRNIVFDTLVCDSESGMTGFWRADGKRFDHQEDFEMPYILEIPRLNPHHDDLSFAVGLSSDTEHVFKEKRNAILSSTGFVGGKCTLWLCKEKVALSQVESGKYRLKPLTRRPWDEVRRFEENHPFQIKKSKLSDGSTNPTQRQKMRTIYVTEYFHPDTTSAMEEFRDVVYKSRSYSISDERLTVEELDCAIEFSKFVHEFHDIFTQKYPISKTAMKRVGEILVFLVKYIKLMKIVCRKTPGLNMRQCSINPDLIKRMIKNCRIMIYLYDKRGGILIPYSVFSDNEVEGFFRDLRRDEGNNLNPNFKEILDRLPCVMLKRQDLNVSKANAHASYSFCERISFNEVLLSSENLLKFREFRRVDGEYLEKSLEDLCELLLDEVTENERIANAERLDGLLFRRFAYVVGYLISSSRNRCRATNRVDLARMFLPFTNDQFSRRRIVNPKKELVSFLWDIDFFMRKNLHKFFSSSSFIVMEEVLNREIVRLYSSQFSKVWKSLQNDEFKNNFRMESRTFSVLVETFVSVRIHEVMDNMGMLPDKDAKSFRNKQK